MTRTATWNNVGTSISQARNVNEALQISGLDFEVVKQPIYLPDGRLVDGKAATVDTKSGKVFGVVGNSYGIVQNQEAFDFIDTVVGEGLEFVKAGLAMNDNIIYMICRLPEHHILRDTIAPYIILQNSFSGYTPLKAAVTELRIICQNQFNLAFRKADDVLSLRHTVNISDKLAQAQQVVLLAEEHMKANALEAESLASIKLSDKEAVKIINNIFKYDENDTQRKIDSMVEKQNKLMDIYYNTPDLQDYRGTGYGLVQAYSDMVTHDEFTRKADDRRFIAITLHPNFMANVVNMVKEVR